MAADLPAAPPRLQMATDGCVDLVSLHPAGYCSQQECVCVCVCVLCVLFFFYLHSGIRANRVQSPEGGLSGEAVNFLPGEKRQHIWRIYETMSVEI